MPVWVPLTTWNTSSSNGLVYVIGGGGFTGSPPAPATNLVQVYDPVMNRWEMETSLPAAQGQNSACFVSPNKIVSAGGGTSSAPSSVTYLGTSFPTTSPLQGVTVTLTATGSTSLGQNGGKVKYSLQYRNGGTSPVTVDAWVMVTMTDGTQTGPYSTTLNRVLAAGATFTENGSVTVPRTWAGGTYYMDGYVGEYSPPNNILYSADHFSFSKAGALAPPRSNEPIVQLSHAAGGGDVAPAASFVSLGATPNPSRGAVDVRFAIAVSGNVEIRMYDLGGRAVSVLANESFAAGSHDVRWTGTDEAGRQLAPGVYFLRIQAGEFSQTERILLTR